MHFSTCFRLMIGMLLLTVMTLPGQSQSKKKILGLSGDWLFSLGDNMKFAKPEYDDSDWEKIYVPANWQREGFRNYHGYAWYRKTIKLDPAVSGSLYLELEKVDDVDEVYFNGHLIGRTGGFPPDYFTAYNYPRKYFIPLEHINKNGKNVIAVRVYDEEGQGGIIGTSSSVGIFSYPNYSNNSMNLFGQWRFHLGDDTSWASPSLDDRDWEEIIVPATWESQGFRDYDGFAWYRKTVKLPSTFKTSDLVLLMGKIDDLDQVFVNGKLVGSTGKMDRKWAADQEWQRYRTYTIPDGLLQAGKYNVIAVRVYDQQGNGGIYEGPITLLPRSEYKEFWESFRRSRNPSSSFLDWISEYFD